MIPHDFVPEYKQRMNRRRRRREIIETGIGVVMLGCIIGLLIILGAMFF